MTNDRRIPRGIRLMRVKKYVLERFLTDTDRRVEVAKVRHFIQFHDGIETPLSDW